MVFVLLQNLLSRFKLFFGEIELPLQSCEILKPLVQIFNVSESIFLVIGIDLLQQRLILFNLLILSLLALT